MAPTPTVEKAAHNFLTSNGGVDTDHSLIDGEGEPVESWLLKEERTFDLPDGGQETYPQGTWMLGIKWDAEPWERIKAGDLTGLSIYGMAEHVALSAKNCDCGGEPANRPFTEAAKSEGMGQDIDHEALAESLTEPIAESVGESVAETVTENVTESVKEALPEDTFKATDDVTELINEFVERLADMDEVEREADAIRDDIRAALTEPEGKEEDYEDEDEEDEEEMKESADEETEKDANLEKGTDAREVASKGIDAEPSGTDGPSYAAILEERGD